MLAHLALTRSRPPGSPLLRTLLALALLGLTGCGAGQGLQVAHRGAGSGATHGSAHARRVRETKLQLTHRLSERSAVDRQREHECEAGSPRPETGLIAYIDEGGLYLRRLGDCEWSALGEPILGKSEALGEFVEERRGGPVAPPVRFSPDGRWIAYGASATVTSLDGGEILRPLGSELLSWSWVGDSDDLVGVTSGGGLVFGNPGSSPRLLLPEGWGANSVISAPDGTIAVSRAAPHPGGAVQGAASIWTLTISDPTPQPAYTAPTGTAELKLAQFAPDQDDVIFWVDRLASSSLAADGLPLELVELNGSGTPTTLSSGSPTRAADVTSCGEKGLAYVVGDGREATREKRLDLASPATGSTWATEELAGVGASVVSPACSPSGSLLAVSAGPNRAWKQGSEDRAVELIQTASGARSPLTSPPAGTSDESPTFIDDGRFILFIRSQTSEGAIHGDAYLVAAKAGARAIGPLFSIGPGSDYFGSYDWSEQFAIQPPATEASSETGLPRCQSAQLSVHLGRGGVALGSAGEEVTFTNTSSSTCTLYGYPGLQMLTAAGQPIPTHVRWGTSMTVQALPKRLVTLEPGAPASFEAGWTDATGYGGRTCPSATTVEITPPGAFGHLTLKWRLAPYGGSTIQELQCGDVAVSPVYAGTSRPQPPSG